jgi:hypothetical protein
MRRFLYFNSATRSSAGLTFSTKNNKRIWQCRRTCMDEDNVVLIGLLVPLLLLPHIKVTKRLMLLMLWRDCLGWLPPNCSLRKIRRRMELKGMLTRMTMIMDGENIYINVGCITIKKCHTPPLCHRLGLQSLASAQQHHSGCAHRPPQSPARPDVLSRFPPSSPPRRRHIEQAVDGPPDATANCADGRVS